MFGVAASAHHGPLAVHGVEPVADRNVPAAHRVSLCKGDDDMKRLLGVLCALAATAAGADTLGDVRAAVSRLSARQPVRATYAIESSVKAAGRFANEKSARLVSAEVAHDASGISITIPQALLDKAGQEARTRNGGNAAQDAIGAIRSTSVVEALDYRAALLSLLDGATVLEEKRLPYAGRPARLIVLKLTPRPKKEGGSIHIGSVKSEERMNLWIADDNLPLAAEQTQKTTAGFLVFHADYSGRTNYTFAHTADRLILARVESSGTGSGMGQNVEQSSVHTLTLH
jgi:hypothetical protein